MKILESHSYSGKIFAMCLDVDPNNLCRGLYSVQVGEDMKTHLKHIFEDRFNTPNGAKRCFNNLIVQHYNKEQNE